MSEDDAFELLEAAVQEEWSGQEVEWFSARRKTDLRPYRYGVAVGDMDDTDPFTFAKQFQFDVKNGVVVDVKRDGF